MDSFLLLTSTLGRSVPLATRDYRRRLVLLISNIRQRLTATASIERSITILNGEEYG